jgi:LPXTG-site transpeptidase (sortase) family protein
MQLLEMVANLLGTDVRVVLLGLLAGIGTLLLIRAGQVWRHRRAYGYNVYTADTLRHRLRRWSLIAAGVSLALVGFTFWQSLRPEPPVLASQDAAQMEAAAVPARLRIPTLAVDIPVIEAPFVGHQWDISRLRGEAAHLAGTAAPGEAGNTVLAGHITIPGAGWGPFRELDTLQPGDLVFIERGQETRAYQVSDTMLVDPTDVEVTYSTDDERLTLITCSDWDDSLETYTQRVVVIAYYSP